MQWVICILLFCVSPRSGHRTMGMNQQTNGWAMWREIYIFFNDGHHVASLAGGGHISFFAEKHCNLFTFARRDVGINFQRLCSSVIFTMRGVSDDLILTQSNFLIPSYPYPYLSKSKPLICNYIVHFLNAN